MMRPGALFFCLLLLAMILVSGCAANVPGGRWQLDRAAQDAFEDGTVLPNHTYYYLGSYAAPDSIIAISNEYTLKTRVWAKVDISEKMLRGWQNWYRTEINWRCPFYGGLILTPDLQRAGIWYSRKTINTIRVPEPGVLEVFQPDSPSLNNCDEDPFSLRF